jgi:DNA-binding response OmpR family regulator
MTGTETILLVEDERSIREFLTDALTSYGHAVITATDGQDAVEKFQENLDRIDLILMDITMPRKDGIAAYKEIMALKPQTKVLLMSGYSPSAVMNLERSHFIQKPMLPAILLTRIRKILDGKQA